mmetsp:Transcript_20346/g.28591  ORF Transcript_20346/g.28591 Transcript_20346/m.28591 type:complete len:186 (+) Transcript_20346:771-1328(+)
MEEIYDDSDNSEDEYEFKEIVDSSNKNDLSKDIDIENSYSNNESSEFQGDEADSNIELKESITKSCMHEDLSMQSVPQFAIDKFMSQLHRIHEEHENEIQEMKHEYERQLKHLQSQLTKALSNPKSSSSSVASHDKCLAKQRELEKDFKGINQGGWDEFFQKLSPQDNKSWGFTILSSSILILRN